jgi:hypothetical protein
MTSNISPRFHKEPESDSLYYTHKGGGGVKKGKAQKEMQVSVTV